MTTLSKRPSAAHLLLASTTAREALAELTSAITALQGALQDPDGDLYRAAISRAMLAVVALQRALGLRESTAPSVALH